MDSPSCLRHCSSLEGVIVPPSETLNPQEHQLVGQMFDEIIQSFKLSRSTIDTYDPLTIIQLMKAEVCEKDEFLKLFFSFIQQELLGQQDNETVDVNPILSHLASLPTWSSGERCTLGRSIDAFAKYLIDTFFLPRMLSICLWDLRC